jgi:putative addiction module killer protein
LDVIPRRVDYYHRPDGEVPSRQWYYSLRDLKAKAAILARITRIERGLLGDSQWVGAGVYELRIDVGPGYRVYFGQEGKTWIWLLCGGDKSTQSSNIKTAHVYWADYWRRRA